MLEAALTAVAAAASRLLQSERPPPFRGGKAGEEREVESVRLCWCPAGRFTMGSPPDEPERRPRRRPGGPDLDPRASGWRNSRPPRATGSGSSGRCPALDRASCPRGRTCRSATSISPKRRSSADAHRFGAPAPALRPTGSSAAHRGTVGIRLPAGRPRPPRSAIRSAASRRTSRASPTTARGRAIAESRRTVGGYPAKAGDLTTCTAIPSSGAATGSTPVAGRGGAGPICEASATRREHGAISRVRRGGAGPTTDGLAGRRPG